MLIMIVGADGVSGRRLQRQPCIAVEVPHRLDGGTARVGDVKERGRIQILVESGDVVVGAPMPNRREEPYMIFDEWPAHRGVRIPDFLDSVAAGEAAGDQVR